MRTTPRLVLVTVATLSALTLACSSPPRLAADLVITRAKIWTGNPRQPEAEALAIFGDRIVEVGGAGEIERWRGTNTTVIDAGGRRVLPGFNDAHVHFVDGGAQLDNVDLKDAATQAEFARRIGERAKAKPGEWVLGGDWDDQRWTPAAAPDPGPDRRRHQRDAGVRGPLRRPHGAGELGGPRPRRHHRADAGSAGRRGRRATREGFRPASSKDAAMDYITARHPEDDGGAAAARREARARAMRRRSASRASRT